MKLALVLFLTFSASAFDYFSYGGLVTKNDPTTENMNLFLAEYLTVGGHVEKEYFIDAMDSRRLSNGLYLRSPIHKARTVSHDEILGFIVTSKILNTYHRFEIWNQLVENNGAYPAVAHDISDLISYNPANFYPWAMITEHENVAQIYLPFYLVNFLLNINKPYKDTSSKIKTWLEISNMPPTKTNQLLAIQFDDSMIKMYGRCWLEVLMHIYHGEDPDFPIYKELEKWSCQKVD